VALRSHWQWRTRWGDGVHDEILCQVTAYGMCDGTRVGVPLGTYRAPTLPLALWWLRDRAAWIADRLDPNPAAPFFPATALVPVAGTVPDVPSVLRAWCSDATRQEKVAEELAAGHLMRLATRDDTTEYELLAESVDAMRMHRAMPLLAGMVPTGVDRGPGARSPCDSFCARPSLRR
jgi:hypothetical protein